MEALIKPADYSVPELKDALEDIDDPEELTTLLEAEEAGENRKTAREAIEQRLEAVDNDSNPVEEPDDEDAATEDADEGTNEQVANDSAPPEGPEEVNEEPADANGGPVDDEAAALSDLDSPGDSPEVLSPDELVQGEEISQRLLANLEGIRSTLEGATNDGGRFEARIRQLQTEVSDLKSYTNALEEFLDENGTGQQVIESVQHDIESIEDDLADLTHNVRTHGRNLNELWEVIADVEDELTGHEELLDGHREDLNDVAADVEGLENRLQDLRETADERHAEHSTNFEAINETLADHADEFDDLNHEIETVADDMEAIATDVDEVAGSVASLEAEVDERFSKEVNERESLAGRVDENAKEIDGLTSQMNEITDDIAALEHLVGDSGRVDQRFEEIEEEIESLLEWREQLSAVIMGGGGQTVESD